MKSLQCILEVVRAKNIISKKTGPEGAKEDIAYVIDHATDIAGEKWFGDHYIMTLAVEIHYIFQHYGIKPKDYNKVIPIGKEYQYYINKNDDFKWVERLYKKNESSNDMYESYFEQLYNGIVPPSRDYNTQSFKIPLISQIKGSKNERISFFNRDMAFLTKHFEKIFDKLHEDSKVSLEWWRVLETEIGVAIWRYSIARSEFESEYDNLYDKDTLYFLNDNDCYPKDWMQIQETTSDNFNKQKSKRFSSFLEMSYRAQGKTVMDLNTQYSKELKSTEPKVKKSNKVTDIDKLSDEQLLKALNIPNYYSYLVTTKRGIELDRERACVSDAKGFMDDLREYYKKYGAPVKIEKFTPIMGWGDPDYPRGMEAYEMDQEHYEGNCVRVQFKSNGRTYELESYVDPPDDY